MRLRQARRKTSRCDERVYKEDLCIGFIPDIGLKVRWGVKIVFENILWSDGVVRCVAVANHSLGHHLQRHRRVDELAGDTEEGLHELHDNPQRRALGSFSETIADGNNFKGVGVAIGTISNKSPRKFRNGLARLFVLRQPVTRLRLRHFQETSCGRMLYAKCGLKYQ